MVSKGCGDKPSGRPSHGSEGPPAHARDSKLEKGWDVLGIVMAGKEGPLCQQVPWGRDARAHLTPRLPVSKPSQDRDPFSQSSNGEGTHGPGWCAQGVALLRAKE